jgi:hypothetical protein
VSDAAKAGRGASECVYVCMHVSARALVEGEAPIDSFCGRCSDGSSCHFMCRMHAVDRVSLSSVMFRSSLILKKHV